MRSSNARAVSAAAPKLSIGQVLHRLANEYPELAPSKIRFLEEQGLVQPARTSAGYRKFSEDDVERIRTILSLQRDHYLPLKVIGEHLDALDRGEHPEVPSVSAAIAPTRGTTSMLPASTDLSRDELQRRAGASKELFEQALSAGLLSRAQPYREHDLAMLASLVELERRGIGPRHLRPFRTAAQHEAGLIEQAISSSSRRKDAAGRARAEREAAELADHLEVVRRSLVRTTLADRREA